MLLNLQKQASGARFSGARPRSVSHRSLLPLLLRGPLLLEGDIADQDTDAVVTAAHWDLRTAHPDTIPDIAIRR